MDDADRADKAIQQMLDASISSAKAGAISSIQGTGICIECGSMVKPVWINDRPHIGRWCCVECRDRWERNG